MKNKIVIMALCFILISTTLAINSVAKIASINNDNTPPNPPKIDGPTSGKTREIYSYNITLTDPDEDDYLSRLEVDFGDGVIVEDCGCNKPWENGEVVTIENSWKRAGTYEIKARVADVYNEWSEWSHPMPVTMPRNILFKNYLLIKLLELSPILQKILS